ncbi:unnamed protein product [Rotaria socialis]|uniref:Uncharacterized protein n=2 Tax=Rotaria socialis TaxID=392032 RepID=A0A820V7H0_9BILA|nr:unnamed protein product [Rotaria socialis]
MVRHETANQKSRFIAAVPLPVTFSSTATMVVSNITSSNAIPEISDEELLEMALISLEELFTSILSITSLCRLIILTSELGESSKFCFLPTVSSKIEQFLLDSGSTINWNDLSQMLPDLSSIRFLSVSLIDRNQKLIPSFIFQNLRALSLGLLEISFHWIVQLVATTPCLIKLKPIGLVDADGFVQSKELDHCEKVQAPLCALNLNLVCNGDDNDCNLYYGEVNRWWNLRGMVIVRLVTFT